MTLPYQPGALTTSVCGSHARPGWLELAVAAAERGELGPHDLREVQDDAVDMALRDQEDAGIDVVTEGEMRRVGFFTAEFYRHLTGVTALPSKPEAGSRRSRPATPLQGAGADRGARRPGRGRGVRVRSHAHQPAHQGDAAGALHAVGPSQLRTR